MLAAGPSGTVPIQEQIRGTTDNIEVQEDGFPQIRKGCVLEQKQRQKIHIELLHRAGRGTFMQIRHVEVRCL